MRAVLMTAAGGPECLAPAELPLPEPGPGQIRVQVRAAGVNPVDAKIRARGPFFEDALPMVPGLDGAGVVDALGPGVTDWQPGDEVWYCNGGLGREPGNYAEYSLVDARVARRKPAALTFEQAAAAPLVLITAWEALYDRGGLEAGQRVLIHGGAGGVGHVAVQLARLRGARVCATAGGADHGAFVYGLGAERVIDHQQEDFVAAVLDWTAGQGVDLALDIQGGEVLQRTFAAMAHYGRLVTLLEPGPDIAWKAARNRNLCFGFELMLTPLLQDLPQARAHQGDILDQCGCWCDEGLLDIHVSQVLPLAEARRAHELIEQGHTQGKIVLVP